VSDDFLETIWAQYAVETEEHIESIESLLVKADAESLNAEEVSGLFRAFHSLKGLSRVMELGALEAIAHRSEDLLGMVREGTAALDKNTVDLLLRSLDAIKVLCEKAVAERADGEKPMALLHELERAFKMVSQGEALTVAEATAPAPPEVVAESATPDSPASNNSAAGNSASSDSSATSSSVPRAEPTKSADGTTDNRQVVFLRLISNGLPILERLANSIATKQDAPQILAVANDIRKPLSWMLKGSNSLGYAGLDTRIEEILNALPVSEEISRADGERMVDVIVAFLDDLKTLGETTGVDLGGESLAKVLARTLKENLLHHLSEVESLLQTLEAPADVQDEEIANLLSQRFSRIHGYLSSLYPQSRTDVPLLLVDAFARAGRNQMGIYSEVITLCRDALQFIRDLLNTSGRQPLKQAPLQAADERLHQRIRDYLWAHDDAGDTPVDTVRQFVASMNIPVELSELLSPDNTRELMELIQDGSLAYLIKAHLESSEDIATAFLEWVHAKGRVITNRTLIENDLSWYEMLFISKDSRAVIEQELNTIDQGSGHVLLLGELGKDNNKPNVPAKPTAAAPKTPAKSPDVAHAAPSSKPASAPISVTAEALPVAKTVTTEAAQTTATTVHNSTPSTDVTAPKLAPAPARSAAPAAASASSNVIRVPGEMLDQFMNQIGEMVLVRGQLSHIISDQRAREGLHRLRQEGQQKDPQNQLADLQQVAENLEDQLRRLQETDALIQGALSRLQDSVMGLRVVPVELVFKRFPRMVRDLAMAQGKQIRLELIGQEVKIDKAMVESLADPLLHMVRNSADHGVEKPEERRQSGKPDEAVIRIQAEQQGSRIIIRVIDDGKGIDPERVRRKAVERGLAKEEESLQMSKEDILGFIFRPAFSTADVVTETSGRGVGMDVVRTSVMRLGGTIHLDSEVGRGTTFTMQMPLSAAVQEVLLVNTANQTMAIPGRYVAELVEVSPDEYQTVKGRTAILLRGNFLPIVRLEEVLGYPSVASQSHRYVVVLSDGQRTLGVSVQEFVGRQELFTKDIHPRLAALPGVGGASILGDGRVVLILDAAALYRLAENLQTPHHLPETA